MNAQYAMTIALVIASALPAGPALAQTPATAPQPPVPARPPAAVVEPARPVPVLADVTLTFPGVLPALPAPGFDSVAMAQAASLFTEKARLMADQAALVTGAQAVLASRMVDDVLSYSQSGRPTADQDKAREEAARQRELDRENRVYEEAYRLLNESRWDRAVERFTDVITMKGARVDAALYWKAYAQDRQGQRAEALSTLGTLSKEFPGSRYVREAKALEAEVRRNAGQPVRPQDAADEDLKLLALNALQHQAPEQAIPMLEKLLAGPASPKLKERALFVLAQSNSAQAREVLRGIAKGNSTPELQSRAVSYLGTHGGRESRAVLADVYGSTSDVTLKKRILRAFAMGGEKDRLMAAAQSEQNAELRLEAVRQLGMHGAHAELSQLYAKETSLDVRKTIISAMATGGNTTRLIEIAKAEQDPELRRAAIRSLGMHGGNKGVSDALIEIYNAEKTTDVKKSVISALAMHNNATALVAIARREEDVTMKKEIVSRLSHMGDSQVARDYLLEILNGPGK